jgi:hypothetical protein
MAVLTNQTVLFVWLNSQPSHAHVYLQGVGGRKMRDASADAAVA